MLKIFIKTFLITSALSLVNMNTVVAESVSILKNRSNQNVTAPITQDAGSSRPTFKKKSIGNLRTAEFDGTDDFLALDGKLLTNTDYTIFLVEKRFDARSNNYFIGSRVGFDGTNTLTGPNHLYGIRIGYASDNSLIFQHGGSGNAITYTQNPFNSKDKGNVHVFQFSRADGLSYYKNGALVASNPLSAVVGDKVLKGNEEMTIGKDNNSGTLRYYKGEFGELAAYKRALDLKEINEIEKYLSDKWGLGISDTPEAVASTGECTDASGYATVVNGGWSPEDVADGNQAIAICDSGFIIDGTIDNLSCNEGEWSGSIGGACIANAGGGCGDTLETMDLYPLPGGTGNTAMDWFDDSGDGIIQNGEMVWSDCPNGWLGNNTIGQLYYDFVCDNGTLVGPFGPGCGDPNGTGASCPTIANLDVSYPVSGGIAWDDSSALAVTGLDHTQDIAPTCGNGSSNYVGGYGTMGLFCNNGTYEFYGPSDITGNPLYCRDDNGCDIYSSNYLDTTPNGHWDISGTYAVNDAINFVCDSGYELNGSPDQAYCQYDQWNYGDLYGATCEAAVPPDCTPESPGYFDIAAYVNQVGPNAAGWQDDTVVNGSDTGGYYCPEGFFDNTYIALECLGNEWVNAAAVQNEIDNNVEQGLCGEPS